MTRTVAKGLSVNAPTIPMLDGPGVVTDAAERRRLMENPGFGRVFTDHIVLMRWSSAESWHDARIAPRRALALDPATVGLHYGQVVFEGLKAFRQVDGSIAVFRLDEHAARFQRSARRLAMPELPVESFVAAVERLVRQDEVWVPDDLDRSLYLRPLMFATEATLALRPADEYQVLFMACVVEGFFHTPRAITVWVSHDYSRAASGGTGEAKCAGNYAGAFAAQRQAVEHGCDQVVWLDSAERRWVEELGGMNLFFVRGTGSGAEVITPPLSGTLLRGVTRDAVLCLSDDLGLRTGEEKVSLASWQEGCADGTWSEVFATGTAARIVSVGEVRSDTGTWTVGRGETGPVARELSRRLAGVQNGALPDVHRWLHAIT